MYTFGTESVDYPDIAEKVRTPVKEKQIEELYYATDWHFYS